MTLESKPFEPVTHDEFSLGKFHGLQFVAMPSLLSTPKGFERHTVLPCLSIDIVATDIVTFPWNNVTWEGWDKKGLGLIHLVTGYVEANMGKLVKHFFGDTLAFEDAAWSFKIDSPNATCKQIPHAYLFIGHKDLFGEGSLMSTPVNSTLNPERLAGDLVTSATGADEMGATQRLLFQTFARAVEGPRGKK